MYTSHMEGRVHHPGHRTDGVTDESSPPTGNHAPVSRGAGGRWIRRLPCPCPVSLFSGSFENWALGKSGAGHRARPWPWQSWDWLGGLSLLLSPNWMEAATPTVQRLKMKSKGPRPSLADLVAWGQSVSLIQGWQLKTQTKQCWGHSELLYARTPYLT